MNSTENIQVNLFSPMIKGLESGPTFTEDGISLRNLLSAKGLSDTSTLILLVNGKISDHEIRLKDGDEVHIHQIMLGG